MRKKDQSRGLYALSTFVVRQRINPARFENRQQIANDKTDFVRSRNEPDWYADENTEAKHLLLLKQVIAEQTRCFIIRWLVAPLPLLLLVYTIFGVYEQQTTGQIWWSVSVASFWILYMTLVRRFFLSERKKRLS